MSKAPRQMEIDGIDNTPLAKALTAAAVIAESMEEMQLRLDEARGKVLDELEKVNLPTTVHKGFRFTITKTPEKVKLNMKRIDV